MLIHIIAKPFVSRGKGYLPGDIVVSPEDIYLFRTKVGEGKIIRLERKASSTISSLKFYAEKFNRPTLVKDVKDYLASIDAKNQVQVEVPTEVEVPVKNS